MPNCYCCGLVHDNNDVIRSLSYIDVVFPVPFRNPNDFTSDDSVNLWYTKFKAKSSSRQYKSLLFQEANKNPSISLKLHTFCEEQIVTEPCC